MNLPPDDHQDAAGIPVTAGLLLAHPPVTEHLHALLSQAATSLHASCSLTLRIGGHLRLAANSDATAESISQWQCTHLCGPSVDAIDDDMPVHYLPDPPAGRRANYARYAAAHGVSCSMSLPLPLPDVTETLAARGALTAYRTLPEPFTPAQQQLAEHVAAQAAGALTLVLHIASRTGRLAAALADQSMIDIAVGILMARDADNEHQALSVLHAQAAAHHVAIADIAADLITEASTR